MFGRSGSGGGIRPSDGPDGGLIGGCGMGLPPDIDNVLTGRTFDTEKPVSADLLTNWQQRI